MGVSANDFEAVAAPTLIAVFAMVVLLLDAIWPRISKRLLANLTILGLVLSAVVAWVAVPKGNVQAPTLMQGMVLADGYSAFFASIFALGAAISVLMSVHYLERRGLNTGEYYALILTTICGALVMASSVNLMVIFIGLEILSISLYILAGYQKERLQSEESAVKYFLLGAFASAFFLYGIALVYGATGSISVQTIGAATKEAVNLAGVQPAKNFLLLAGVSMLLVGFCFKVAVVPFHIWTPDVYEGAPTSVTAFMSVAAKAAGFAAFLRVFVSGFQDQSLQLQISAVMASIAALTMLVGNVVAVVQRNLKRMLAYSSIAHAGYIMAGLVAVMRPAIGAANQQDQAISSVLFYTLVYTVSNLGAFGVIMALERKGEEVQDVADLAGVGSRYPLLGVLMTLFMLSLAGMPPLAGFWGKLAIGQAMIGMNTPLVWLIVLFALTSVVSFYYYLGVVRAMYMEKPAPEDGAGPTFSADLHLKLGLALAAIGTLVLVFPNGALAKAQEVAKAFLGPGGPFSAMR